MRDFLGMSLQQHLMAGAAIVAVATASPAMAQTRQFNVPAQPASRGIPTFARQAGVQIIASGNVIGNRRTNAVQGNYSVGEGLRILLGRTGLSANSGGAGGIITIRAGQAPGEAQAGSAAADTESVDREIVVTGTNIRGAQPVGAPLYTYDRAAIERTGATTAEQFLSTLSQNSGGARTTGTSQGGQIPNLFSDAAYGSAVNLRGLGNTSTLVLVNGRRLALSGGQNYEQFADISLIPLSAVERIEVLPDGASALYGADAVGGVVNIILRQRFNGARSQLTVGTTTRGGATETRASQSVGAGWSTGSVLANYEYSDTNPLLATQRRFSQANVNGPYPLFPGQTVHSAYLTARQSIGSRFNLTADFLFSQRTTQLSVDTLAVGGSNFFDKSRSQDFSGSLSANAELGAGWEFNAQVGQSLNRLNEQGSNDLGFFLIDNSERSRYETRYVEYKADGPIFHLPAGAVTVALGGGLREERYHVLDRFGVPGPDDRFDLSYFYGEARVPLVGPFEGANRPRLVLSGAVRYEDYSNFGTTTNPRVGLEFEVIRGFRLRGSWGTSFKAPTLAQIDPTGRFFSDGNILVGANRISALVRIGSNPDLRPETSRSINIGFDFEPRWLSGLRARVTYFDINYSGRILSATGNPLQALTNPAFATIRTLRSDIGDAAFNALAAAAISGNPIRYNCPNRFKVLGNCIATPANYNAIINTGLLNLGRTESRGVDVSLEYSSNFLGGILSVSASGTYVDDLSRQVTLQSAPVEFVDTIYNTPDLRFRTAAAWSRGGWELNAAANYVDGYRNNSVLPNERVGSWLTFDAVVRFRSRQAGWTGFLRGWDFTLSARNLFDRNPPFVNTLFSTGYDPANADPLGRVATMSIAKEW